MGFRQSWQLSWPSNQNDFSSFLQAFPSDQGEMKIYHSILWVRIWVIVSLFNQVGDPILLSFIKLIQVCGFRGDVIWINCWHTPDVWPMISCVIIQQDWVIHLSNVKIFHTKFRWIDDKQQTYCWSDIQDAYQWIGRNGSRLRFLISIMLAICHPRCYCKVCEISFHRNHMN